MMLLALILGLVVILVPSASAVSGYSVTNTHNPVHTYNRPDPTSGVFRSLSRGTPIDIVCQDYGTVTRGSNIWDQLTGQGWMSDAYSSTPVYNGFSPGIPRCGIPTIAPPTPSGGPSAFQLIGALARAAAQVNQAYQPGGVKPWACACDHFVGYVYGRTASGHNTAMDHYHFLLNLGMIHTDSDPPGGSLVFYGITLPGGHVAFSLGGGNIITTPWDPNAAREPKCQAVGVVYETNLNHFDKYLGWSWPDPSWLA